MDKDGTISISELGEGFEDILSPEELKELMRIMDIDKSGSITKSEFKTFLSYVQIGHKFNAADKDDNGYVSVHDVRIALKESGVKDEYIEQSLKDFFKSTDFNKDDKVPYNG